MVSAIGSVRTGSQVIVNPTLGYKLDPGEPGIPSGAPASQSVLRVMSQEFANYIDFKKQAAEQGGVIISGGIYLDMQKRGSFLAAVAGKTKVLIYIPGSNDGQGREAGPTDGANKLEQPDQMKQSEITRKIDELYRKLQMTQDPVEREKLQQQILLLTMAMNALMFGMKMPEFLIGMLLNTTV
ncbi:MAG: hypothetical protein WHS64_04940 [Fervidobacterium sp.]|uniref:Uncharacterized protein n=1 Tax=Fervidobacterium gondwanense DSM 13020 TaxID=1121883 RepID=A0A1M7T3N9_FERGO|nr:hypothetical protein [Fervidobacterium gondwanense]SHN65385.1 hypothetical protein SAMN02745226_01513 [Fervidobacterium gondwanense DSM 13020]